MHARWKHFSSMVSQGVALGILAFAAACSEDEHQPSVGLSPIRRLTRTEYSNTVRDLLADDSNPGKDFAPEEEAFGFNNNAEVLSVSDLLVEQWMNAAEFLARRAVIDLGWLLPCDPGGVGPGLGEDACAEEFIRRFGQRAWRRPLDQSEVGRLVGVFNAGRDLGFASGIELVVTAMLQSPNFLYLVEVGTEVKGQPGLRRLGDWELASRLSYMLWQSMPDEELFAAAEASRLHESGPIMDQARRMLKDGRARAMVADFHGQWLELDEFETLEKDTTVYPAFQPQLRELFRAEIAAFMDHAAWEGSLLDVFTAPYTYANQELAAFYGVAGPSGDEWARVELDPSRSAGLLTKGGTLALYAKTNQSSPVHRGKFVRERLMCQLLPPPPPNINVMPPELDPNLTTRERFAAHREDRLCAGCHSLMDPIGLGFEHYDGLGQWRDQENGLPIDDSGEIVDADIAGPFQGVTELGRKLTGSAEVKGCIVKNWFRFGYGRTEHEEDERTLARLNQRFIGSGGDVPELLLALTQTDAFFYKRVEEGGVK